MAVAVAFSLGLTTKAAAQNQVGSITDLVGAAQIQRGGQTFGAARGTALALRDRIATAAASSLNIALTDGSQLTLGEGSTLVLDEAVVPGGVRAATRVSLLGGQVRSIVSAAIRGAAPNFEVRTPNAIAGVRGTVFTTTFLDGVLIRGFGDCQQFTRISTGDGVVGVSNPTSGAPTELLVPAGYETIVACNRPPTDAGPIGVSAAGGFVGLGPGASGAPPPACPVCVIPGH